MTEINLFPKFLDNAMSPVATSVGNTLSSVWSIVFGGIDFYSQKLEQKRILNLNQFKQELENKVSSIPEEKLVEPPLHILGPTLEASKFYFESTELRSMFANLIAASANLDYDREIHPSFVEILKQLSSDEAKILTYIKEGSFPLISVNASTGNSGHYPILENFSNIDLKAYNKSDHLILSYLKNINRLGLITIHSDNYMNNSKLYEELMGHPIVVEALRISEQIGKQKVIKSYFSVTPFGQQFYRICVKEK